MKLAIFGATGTVGVPLVAQALDAGHHVRVLARTPTKVKRAGPSLTVLAGDAKDPEAVAATMSGCDAVISALGGFADSDSIRVGTALITAAMQQAGIRRLVVVQGFHLDFAGDPRNVGRILILPLLWLGSRTLIADSRSMATQLAASSLDWTLVRVPRITNGASTGRTRVGQLRLSPLSSVVNADVAQFALTALGDPTTFGTAPMLAREGAHVLGTARCWLFGRRPNPDADRDPASHAAGPTILKGTKR
jgi:putative NADH-flavin reductase